MATIVKSICFCFIIHASFATLFSVTDARRFNVGVNGVWVVNPHENYKTWAGRNRFQVNDTVYFKYPKGSDSVQQVMKLDFDFCNIGNPLKKYDDGESVVTLDRSGVFYFISGNHDHCIRGQQLIVVVLAARNNPVAPIAPAKPPSKSPAATQPPKAHSPLSHNAPANSPSTTQPPIAHSPLSHNAPVNSPSTAQSPKAHSPVSHIAPANSPSPKSISPVSSVSPASSPSKSPPPNSSVSPVSHSPAGSPSKAPKVSPKNPSPLPKSSSPVSSPSPSQAPSTSSPSNAPVSSPSSDLSPPLASSPSSGNVVAAPAPSPKSSASGVAVTSVMTTVLSVAFSVFMFA